MRLVAKTRATSPSVISLATGELYNWAKGRYISWREKKKVYLNLFGFLNNADFIVSSKLDYIPDQTPGLSAWDDPDVRTAKAIFEGVANISTENVKIDRLALNTQIDLKSNICSMGGPLFNKFSRWLMGYEIPSDNFSNIPELPYVINFQPDERCIGKGFDELKKIHPTPNYTIMNQESGEDIYIPELNPYTNELMRDYGMIIKTKSIHKVARSAGRKNLMIAGCYHVGTEAGGYIMEKEDILNHIWKSVNDKDFQAIYVAFVRDGHPIDVELLEVLPLE
jgi:hypothetical protein